MLTSVQHYQYGTPVFIIFNKGGNMRFIMDNWRLNQQLDINMHPLPENRIEYAEDERLPVCNQIISRYGVP